MVPRTSRNLLHRPVGTGTYYTEHSCSTHAEVRNLLQCVWNSLSLVVWRVINRAFAGPFGWVFSVRTQVHEYWRLFVHACPHVTCTYKILDNKRDKTLCTDVTACSMYTSMKQDGVSNEPVTFACHMCTYTLPWVHQKLSEIDGETRFYGHFTEPVRKMFCTPPNTLRTRLSV